jgi:hypothetical protein
LGYEDEAWSIGAAHKASDSITFTSMLETELKTSVKNPAAIYPISVPGKPVGGGDRV